jgi:hypothetical protein
VSEYDPESAPDPDWWLSLDESERMEFALDSQRLANEDLPSPRAHAALHAIVENQVAMGDEIPVAATLQRLIAEGLGRHDAVHAVGSVMAKHIYRAMQSDSAAHDSSTVVDPNQAYWRGLDGLSAEGWRRSR